MSSVDWKKMLILRNYLVHLSPSDLYRIRAEKLVWISKC